MTYNDTHLAKIPRGRGGFETRPYRKDLALFFSRALRKIPSWRVQRF